MVKPRQDIGKHSGGLRPYITSCLLWFNLLFCVRAVLFCCRALLLSCLQHCTTTTTLLTALLTSTGLGSRAVTATGLRSRAVTASGLGSRVDTATGEADLNLPARVEGSSEGGYISEEHLSSEGSAVTQEQQQQQQQLLVQLSALLTGTGLGSRAVTATGLGSRAATTTGLGSRAPTSTGEAVVKVPAWMEGGSEGGSMNKLNLSTGDNADA
jgi:hypothetical protein